MWLRQLKVHYGTYSVDYELGELKPTLRDPAIITSIILHETIGRASILYDNNVARTVNLERADSYEISVAKKPEEEVEI